MYTNLHNHNNFFLWRSGPQTKNIKRQPKDVRIWALLWSWRWHFHVQISNRKIQWLMISPIVQCRQTLMFIMEAIVIRFNSILYIWGRIHVRNYDSWLPMMHLHVRVPLAMRIHLILENQSASEIKHFMHVPNSIS